MRATRRDNFEQQIDDDADRFVPTDEEERIRIESILTTADRAVGPRRCRSLQASKVVELSPSNPASIVTGTEH